jgi:hypothetical protein
MGVIIHTLQERAAAGAGAAMQAETEIGGAAPVDLSEQRPAGLVEGNGHGLAVLVVLVIDNKNVHKMADSSCKRTGFSRGLMVWYSTGSIFCGKASSRSGFNEKEFFADQGSPTFFPRASWAAATLEPLDRDNMV